MSTVIIQKIRKRILTYRENLADDLYIELVKIPAGTFTMGSSEQESNRESEKPQHKVTLKSFLMGIYPVTQAQWQFIAQREDLKEELDLKPDPSDFKGSTRPVEQVPWSEAVEFCQRLSKMTKRRYRLPSEAEWEYACRAGTTTPFHFGETLTPTLANYDDSLGGTTPVGQFYANDFGLYDMHGNVLEWCEDDWHENYRGAPTDGSAWLKRDEKEQNQVKNVLRGGSWCEVPDYCRSAFRVDVEREFRLAGRGFRVVCEVKKSEVGSGYHFHA